MGARESNAGDEFHLLWAVRRLLLMLQSNASLRRVVIEGVSPIDPAAKSPSLLSGVDMAEYFDGEGFEQAERVGGNPAQVRLAPAPEGLDGRSSRRFGIPWTGWGNRSSGGNLRSDLTRARP